VIRNLSILLRKEFRQIFRNRMILAISLIAPVMQFLILPLAASYEIKHIRLAVVDRDHSVWSRRLIEKITASGYFQAVDEVPAYPRAYGDIQRGEADGILDIPPDFGKDIGGGGTEVFLAMNAIDGTKANLGAAYLTSILRDFGRQLALERMPATMLRTGTVTVRPTEWFNPRRNYKLALIPGILALLVTMVGGFLSSLNIVREKETGTIEQINVSPVKKRDFILAKLIPFWLLAMVVFTVGLLLCRFVYGIAPRGSIVLLYGFTAVYLLAVLGFGLLISTFCHTQQQAMFLMFFFMMVFVLLGGLFTPVDSMPVWAQWLTRLNPVAYLIDVIRMVMLRGSGWKDILPQFAAILAMALILNAWAVMNYRKTS
jgi:ABC-2 type transport system permease protein